MHQHRKDIINLVRQVGKIQKKAFGSPLNVQTKKNDGWLDLVTEIDHQSEKIYFDYLKRHFPDHTILSEESLAHNVGRATRWIIDPLDGTINYAHGLPFFGTSIALEENNQVTMGAIYDPLRDELFYTDDTGAYLNDQKIKVNDQPLAHSIIATEIIPRQDKLPKLLAYLNQLSPRARTVKSLGAMVLEMAYVACGRLSAFVVADTYFPWDIAVGQLLVTKAGGRCTDWQGQAVNLKTCQPLIASNGICHDEILKLAPKKSN